MTAKIYHADLYGTRRHKYDTLLYSDLHSVDWQELSPNAPHYLFMPQEQAFREEYEAGWGVNDIFTLFSLGLNSHRDNFAIAFSKQEMITRLTAFRNALSDDECYAKFGLTDNPDWQLSTARAAMRQKADWEADVATCLYRPFDTRICFLSPIAMDRPRLNVNRSMLEPNLSLVTTRQTREPFAALATNLVCGQHKIVSVYDGSYVFPLWRYPTEQEAAMGMEREANLNPQFVAEVKGRIGEAPTPEDIFHYAYAVFHAPTYRNRYAAFLKTDFPRLPLPPNAETFHALAALGTKLVALHLLEDPSLQQHGIAYPVSGTHTVKKMRAADRYIPPLPSPTPPELGAGGPSSLNPLPREGEGRRLAAGERVADAGERVADAGERVADAGERVADAGERVASGAGGRPSGRVRLNDTEYFDNVPPEAWEFRVGGYQPAAKWLDDRAGRALTEADITHYRRMVAAMRETAALLPQVDAAFQPLI